MTQPPITLAEFRDHLNLGATEGVDANDEMWQAVISATGYVEAKCGPIRPRTQTDRVEARPVRVSPYPTYLYPLPTTVLLLPVRPVISLTSVTPVGGTALDLSTLTLEGYKGRVLAGMLYGCFDVEYIVGQNPIPQELMDAVKLRAKLTWDSQRGPSNTTRFTGMGDTGADGMSSGLDKFRADELMQSYLLGPGAG